MADQIDRLIFQVTGQDRGGGKVLSDSAKHADAAHTSFSRLGSTLTGLDGPFGQVTSAAGTLGDALQGTTGFATKLGLGLTAAGVGLIAFAAKDQQAQRQLRQSVENTGASYADYRGQIEEAIKSQERNAHTADDTQNALNTLTTATQDTSRSLSEMNLVADIAASKHETLAEAATQLVQAQAGNTRAFKSFGIVLDTTLPKSEAINKALKELTDRLSGQASASVDTFAGRLKVAATQLEDNIAKLGKYGPEITAAGVALTVYAGVLQLKAARTIADTAATAAETRAETSNAAARIRTAEAANIQAAAIQRATIAQAEGAGRTSSLGYTGLPLVPVQRPGGGPLPASGMGMAARLGRGALIGGLGYYAATTAGTAVGGSTGRYLGDIGGGAAIGAGIGSIVPGVGTAVGAGVGAVVGLGSALLHSPAAPAGKSVADTEAGYQRAAGALKTLQAAAARSTGMLHQAQEAAIKDAQAALKAGQANHDYATSLIHEADAAKTATLSIDGQLTALNKTQTAALNLSDAEDGMRKAMHNAAQAAHDGGTALKGHSQAAIDNRDALRAVVKQEQDVLTAMRAHGASAEKVRSAAIAMSRAIRNNATDIYGNKTAVDDLLGSLHALPGQVSTSLVDLQSTFTTLEANFTQLADDFFNIGLHAGGAFDAGWNIGVSGASTSDPNPTHNTGNTTSTKTKAAKQAGAQLGTVIVSGAAPVIDNGIDKATTAALDKAKQKLEQQRQLEHSVLSEITGAYQNTKKSLIDAASLANRQSLSDSLGSPMGMQSVLASKRQFANQMIHFARLIHRLGRAGYNETVIEEIEGLGVAGIPAAEELLHGGAKERRAINRAERRIEKAAGQISSQITGTDYLPEIARTLKHLPNDLDRALEKGLRHLNINVSLKETARHRGRRTRNKS